VRFHLSDLRASRFDRAQFQESLQVLDSPTVTLIIRTRTAAGGLSIVFLKTEVMSMMNHTIRRPPQSCAALFCAAFAA
jgi:hypothetical protein